MLEQIKQELADSYKYKFQNWNHNRILNEFDVKQGFELGFETCMDLELPILYSNWLIVYLQGIKYRKISDGAKPYGLGDFKSDRELFTYWIENVYNKEI